MRHTGSIVSRNLTAPVSNGPVSTVVWERFGPENFDLWEYVRTSMLKEGDWMMWLRMKKATSWPNDIFDKVNDSRLEKYLK